MSDQQYFYQTLQVSNQVPFSGGPSERGTAVGGAVKLLHKASQALNGWAVSWRTNRELERIKPEIEKAMLRYEEQFLQCRASTGALVVVGIMEWEQPDPTGVRAQAFLSIHVGGAGSDAVQVLKKYQSRDNLVQGPPEGWVRKNGFIWVTRKGA